MTQDELMRRMEPFVEHAKRLLSTMIREKYITIHDKDMAILSVATGMAAVNDAVEESHNPKRN